MEGARSTGKALSVVVERSSRYTKLQIVMDKTAHAKTHAVTTSLSSFPLRLRKTITIDNGSENTGCRQWGLTVYRCNPYHSWEKGSVENMIGRIRRYIPKGTDLALYSDQDIQHLEHLLNNTPRKCLGYKTPKETLLQFLGYKPSYIPKWCNSK